MIDDSFASTSTGGSGSRSGLWITPKDAGEIANRLHWLEHRVALLEGRPAEPSVVAPAPPPPVQAQTPKSLVVTTMGDAAMLRPSDPPPLEDEPKKPIPAAAAHSVAGHLAKKRASADERRPEPAAEPTDFMTTEEFTGMEQSHRSPTFWKREPDEGLEVALATRVLPIVGGLLLLVGAAIGATLIEGAFAPLVRVVIGYLCASGLIGAGWFVRKKAIAVGQATIASGFALGYFISFGAHFLPPMQVFAWAPSLVLMLGFAAGLVLLADRWRSQPMAAFGLVLGVVGALVSAPVSESFALVSLGGLALAAGGMFLRREWIALTTGAVALVYLSMLLLWMIAPVPSETPAIVAHLSTLVGIHIVFTLAFMRWGRPWVARQNALLAEQAAGTLPSQQMRTFPFASGYSIINSLAFGSLSLLLLWDTKVLWSEVHWLLFALAGTESLRLATKQLASRREQPFHATFAFVFLCCGVVSLFSGMTESAVLAGAALAAAIAGSRAPMLRVIRPLGGLAAGVAAYSYIDNGVGAGFLPTGSVVIDYIAAALPVLFLFASALPWDRIAPLHHEKQGAFYHVMEGISSSFRAMVAVVCAAIFTAYIPGQSSELMLFAVVLVLVAGGIATLGATSWCAGLVLGLLALSLDWTVLSSTLASTLLLSIAAVIVSLLLVDTSRKVAKKSTRIGLLITGILSALILSPTAVAGFSIYEDAWVGIFIWGVAVALAAGTFIQMRFAPLPLLVAPDHDSEEPAHKLAWFRSPAIYPMIGLLLVGYFGAVFVDSESTFISPLIVGLSMLPLLLIKSGLPRAVPGIAAAALAIAWCVGWLLWMDVALGSTLLPAAIGLSFSLVGLAARRTVFSIAGLVAAMVAGIGMVLSLMHHLPFSGGSAEVLALASCFGVALLIAYPMLLRIRSDFDQPSEITHIARILGCFGLLLTMFVLAQGTLLPGVLVTPSWGILGAALLLAGLAFADRTMRYTALAVFALALGRIFLHDMIGLDAVTRAAAFFGIGLLLVIGGIAYGLSKRRLLASEGSDQDKQP